MTAEPPTLITFPPMIDSEACRLLLHHYRIAYTETPHVLPCATVAALWAGGTPQIPLFRGQGITLAGPRALAYHFDTVAPPERHLLPANTMDLRQVNADWARFNGALADATAALAYYYLLPHRDIMMEPFGRGVPSIEARALKYAYPAIAGLFRLLLKLSPATAGAALDQVRIMFAETDARLRDGRRYLIGDRLTLSDIALAAACGPVLLPAGDAAPIPTLSEMPRAYQAIVMEMRQHATARFVQGIFDDVKKHVLF